jgi:hypothetical protein
MGFELYVQCFGETERIGIPRAAVRSLFPVIEEQSKPDYWRVEYDGRNSCDIGVTDIPGQPQRLKGFYIDRPCADRRLWDARMTVLRMGTVFIFWPGGPPVVAESGNVPQLPKDITDSLGPGRSVRSADELLCLLQDS